MRAALTVFAVLVLVLAVIFARAESIIEWKKMDDQTNIRANEIYPRVKLMMALRNEELVHAAGTPRTTTELAALAAKLDDGCAMHATVVDPADDISVRLAHWRRIIAPSCEAVSKATHAVAQLGLTSHCQRRFDHFYCETIPKDAAEAAFGIESERVVELHSGVERLSAINIDHVALPDGIEYVDNLKVGPAHVQPRRHDVWKTTEDDGDAPFNPSYAPHGANGNAPQVVAFNTHTITSPSWESPSAFYFSFLMFDLYCSDGATPTQHGVLNKPECNKAGSMLPKKIEFAVQATAAGNAEIYNVAYDFTKLTCMPAGQTAVNTTTVCSVDIKSQPTDASHLLTLWKPVVMRSRAVFDDGENATTHSKWVYTRMFWNSSYFPIKDMVLLPETPVRGSDKVPSGSFKNLDADDLLFQQTPGRTHVPADYRKMYGVPESEPVKINATIAQGVLEFSGGNVSSPFGRGYKKSDLKLFMDRTKDKRWSVDNVQYIGLDPEIAAAGEAQLDIQMMMGVAPGIKTTFWTYNTSGDSGFATAIGEWAHQVFTETGDAAHMKWRPSTWSTSYGSCEDNTDANMTKHMKRASTYIATFSDAGITSFVSSGDAGSSCTGQAFVFAGSFPATVPSVVSVGATAVRFNEKTGRLWRETSDGSRGDLITSSGGFSTVFPIPAFQTDFANERNPYVNDKYLPAKNLGRAVPDVTALGSFILAVVAGGNMSVSGTSASSPLFAALVTLVNNKLLLDGKGTLKKANEWINTHPNLWVDIVGGSNCYGRGFGSNINANGICYSAMEGWDATSGHGEFDTLEATYRAAIDWQDKAKNKHLGAIIGGVIGGVVFLVIVGYLYMRKRATSSGDGSKESLIQDGGQYGTADQRHTV